jgi:hypothetical protein
MILYLLGIAARIFEIINPACERIRVLFDEVSTGTTIDGYIDFPFLVFQYSCSNKPTGT